MHKYIALFFSVLLFLTACRGNITSGNVISPKQMTSLLTDLHIIDGRLYALNQNQDTLYKYGTAKYLSLFKKYGVDSSQFRNSMRYYSRQPAEMLAIYDDVLKNLKQKTDSLNTLQAKINLVTDSAFKIKNARLLDSIKKVEIMQQKLPSNKSQKSNAVPK